MCDHSYKVLARSISKLTFPPFHLDIIIYYFVRVIVENFNSDMNSEQCRSKSVCTDLQADHGMHWSQRQILLAAIKQKLLEGFCSSFTIWISTETFQPDRKHTALHITVKIHVCAAFLCSSWGITVKTNGPITQYIA